MSNRIPEEKLPINWTLEDLLSTLGKIPREDLLLFIQSQYNDSDITSWDHPTLLEFAISLIQTWENSSTSQSDFLIQATADLCRYSFEAFVRMLWEEVPVAQPLLWNWHMGVFTESLQKSAIQIFNRNPRSHDLICNVSPGTSKPVCENSPVLMGNGKYKPLKDIVEGDKVIGKSGFPCLVKEVHKQGSLPCVRIRTYGGREVIAALDHPILTSKGWMNAGNITVGTPLALIYKTKKQTTYRQPKNVQWYQQYQFDSVESVQDIGERKCRCLTVETDASFVVDGIIVHNSTVWSVLFPCWVWTRMPEARLITASHTEILVTDLAAYARDVMKGSMYKTLYPEIEFTETQDSKGYYRNTKGGERFTCTVAGKSPTGHHAHFIIIDDPIDPKKVLSAAERKTASDFLTTVVPSRRMRGAQGDLCVTMLVMQRLGIGDPTDVMLGIGKREGAFPIRHICLPAEITDNVSPKELRKYYTDFNIDANVLPDGLMDPVRLNRIALNEQKAILGMWQYTGQFLQAPRPQEGGMFKKEWFTRRVRAAPFNSRRIRYWDRASSVDTSACATAGVLMSYDGERIYVEDVVYGRWEPDERNAIMLATAQRDRTRYGKYEPVICVEAEGGSAGRDAWLGIVRSLMGFPVKEDQVRGSKDVRAEPWATQLSAGNVHIVDNGESEGLGRSGWDINEYVEEHLHFRPTPGGKLGRAKDRVDASSGAFNRLVGLKRLFPPLRTYRINTQNSKVNNWIVVCSYDEIGLLDLRENKIIVVTFDDPDINIPIILENNIEGVMCSEESSRTNLSKCIGEGSRSVDKEEDSTGVMVSEVGVGGSHESNHSYPPPFSLTEQQETIAKIRAEVVYSQLDLKFADIDPADYQEVYDQPVQPWNKKVSELQLSRDQAKKLWSHILKKYDKPWQVLVLVDKGGEDGRAISSAFAIADILRLPRSAVYFPGRDMDTIEEEPKNNWIYDQIRQTRYLVVS